MATSKIQTGLRLNETSYEKLRLLSSREARSMNNLIEYIIQLYLENYEATNGPIHVPNKE